MTNHVMVEQGSLPPRTSTRPARLTVLLCGVSALLTLTLALTSAPRWRSSDGAFLLLALTPYLGVGVLAIMLLRSRRWAWSLFGLAVALSLAGVGCFALDSWSFHTVAEYRMVQRFTVIVVPLLHLVIVAPFALVVLLRGAEHGR
ncbi:hypothetical protein KBY93_09300 [Synechococcus sp. J7-Johnson]|uniref:hypothetical protein n=1 Tax=Synechococcus sp. J7-Johnson TaxID=2823737 RepID=UPI0020CEAF39|nr:hypothetical protein [Synechococcus sp. J7-Johnson]MCP9840830.1 hypothetical protein [Synechococcus sp. J7-Johnson]